MSITLAPVPPKTPTVPEALKVSTEETLLFAFKGRGNQVYEWVPKKNDPTQYECPHGEAGNASLEFPVLRVSGQKASND